MKKLCTLLLTLAFVAGAVGTVAAQEKPKKTPEERFAALDKDGDKKLSEQEFIGKAAADKAENAKKRFKRFDKDSDGSVTLEEFKAGQAKPKAAK
jgi:Ca2+-binding EF-hand superfamily protein